VGLRERAGKVEVQGCYSVRTAQCLNIDRLGGRPLVGRRAVLQFCTDRDRPDGGVRGTEVQPQGVALTGLARDRFGLGEVIVCIRSAASPRGVQCRRQVQHPVRFRGRRIRRGGIREPG
jgi:hypothetical protein